MYKLWTATDTISKFDSTTNKVRVRPVWGLEEVPEVFSTWKGQTISEFDVEKMFYALPTRDILLSIFLHT